MVAYQDQDFIRETVEKTIENRHEFIDDLKDMNLTYYDSEANFVFVKLPFSGDSLFEFLLSQGFIVRSVEALGHSNEVRIAFDADDDMYNISDKIHIFHDYLNVVE